MAATTVRLALVSLVASVAAGCSIRATMLPIEGPMAQQQPVPVLSVLVKGVAGNEGPLSFVLGPGDTCAGRWASAAGAGLSVTTGSLISQHGAVAFLGTTIDTGTGRNPGRAIATCTSGRTFDIEFMTGAGTAHGFGVAKDSAGNLYRMVF